MSPLKVREVKFNLFTSFHGGEQAPGLIPLKDFIHGRRNQMSFARWNRY